MSCSDNLVLRSMSHFVSFRIKAVSSVYGISTVMSNSVIKDVVWVWDFFCSFGFIIFVCFCICFYLCVLDCVAFHVCFVLPLA